MIRLHIALVIILLSTLLWSCTHLSEYQLVTPALPVLAPLFLTSPSSTLNFFFKFMTFGFIFHSGLRNHPLIHAVFGFYSFDTLALSDRICKYPLAAFLFFAIGYYPLVQSPSILIIGIWWVCHSCSDPRSTTHACEKD